jgi:hypothetical protein
MKTKTTLKKNIDVLFNKYGLKMLKNDKSESGIYLPIKADLLTSKRDNYESKRKTTKINVVKEILYKENHFEITKWEIFLPNLKVKDDEEKRILKYIFDCTRIYYSKGELIYYFHNLIDFLIPDILNNKDLINILSKEFQLKKLFTPNKEMTKQLQLEFLSLIEIKMKEFGIKNILEIELPEIILNNIDKINDRI